MKGTTSSAARATTTCVPADGPLGGHVHSREGVAAARAEHLCFLARRGVVRRAADQEPHRARIFWVGRRADRTGREAWRRRRRGGLGREGRGGPRVICCYSFVSLFVYV